MPAHYYSKEQDSELRLTKIKAKFFGHSLEIITGSGVFSVGKVDRGTEVLLENCLVKEGWDILDLGCGYGIVGIAIAKAFPGSNVLMSDVNKRACKIARMNARNLGLMNAGVRQGDCFEKIDEKFDAILLNPPQSAGKDICIRMLHESKDHLKDGGSLQIVARHNKGGEALSEEMEKIFGNLETLARKSGYRVYISRNPSHA